MCIQDAVQNAQIPDTDDPVINYIHGEFSLMTVLPRFMLRYTVETGLAQILGMANLSIKPV